MASNLKIEYDKNNSYKPHYETDRHAIIWRRGLDLFCNDFKMKRFRENTPKNLSHSLNWRVVMMCLIRTIQTTNRPIKRWTFSLSSKKSAMYAWKTMTKKWTKMKHSVCSNWVFKCLWLFQTRRSCSSGQSRLSLV